MMMSFFSCIDHSSILYFSCSNREGCHNRWWAFSGGSGRNKHGSYWNQISQNIWQKQQICSCWHLKNPSTLSVICEIHLFFDVSILRYVHLMFLFIPFSFLFCLLFSFLLLLLLLLLFLLLLHHHPFVFFKSFSSSKINIQSCLVLHRFYTPPSSDTLPPIASSGHHHEHKKKSERTNLPRITAGKSWITF